MPPKGKEVPDGLLRPVGVVVNAWAVARASRTYLFEARQSHRLGQDST